MTTPGPLHGRRILITGATAGIGHHTATALAGLGAHVLVVGRDADRGRAAVEAITAELGTAGGSAELLTADLSSQADIRQLADAVQARGPLDVLINNVGGLYTQRWKTIDGVEASLALNALNPFLLTTLLRPALQAAPAGQVVYVTGGRPGRLDLTDLQNQERYVGLVAYSHAKTAMMALALEQAEQWRSSGVTVNVVYPGAANTPMTQAMTSETLPPVMRPIYPLFRFMMNRQQAAKASRSSVALASETAFAGSTATYYNTKSRPRRWPKSVQDAKVRHQLWKTAQHLTGLSDRDAPDRPVPERR